MEHTHACEHVGGLVAVGMGKGRCVVCAVSQNWQRNLSWRTVACGSSLHGGRRGGEREHLEGVAEGGGDRSRRWGEAVTCIP